MARLDSLPRAEQAAFYLSRLDRFDGPIDTEVAEASLVSLGADAISALLPLLTVKGRAWRSAKLLADIGLPLDEVVRALDAVLTLRNGSDQAWVARALSLLGRLDLVLDRADLIGENTVITAVAVPYTNFRNAVRLSYEPLEAFLEQNPQYNQAMAKELGPGRGYCDINVDEVSEAVRGLTSAHTIVRWHAVCVLGERGLGAGVARRVLPLVAQLVGQDGDPTVRRLAILSLLWWRKDSRPYAETIRQALDDPVADVRDAASYWLRSARDSSW